MKQLYSNKDVKKNATMTNLVHILFQVCAVYFEYRFLENVIAGLKGECIYL